MGRSIESETRVPAEPGPEPDGPREHAAPENKARSIL